MKARSALIVMSLVVLGLGATAQPASASFHLIKIREVYAGSLLNPNSQFIELQMFASNQTQTGNHLVVIYDASDTPSSTYTLDNVSNGANQATILLASTAATAEFGVTADEIITGGSIPAAGGKICFDATNIDCVAWGDYAGSSTGVGSPAPALGGGQSIERNISAGCATLLEASDDTNNSANDFQTATPSPRPNSVTPTETECTGGGDDKVPSSEITAPKHKTAITAAESTNFQGTASDQGGSQIAKVEVALRQKIKGAGCKWWNGNKFAAGSCSGKVFQTASGDKKWSYDLPRTLKPTGRKFKAYRLFSRATDGDGNVETLFEAGRNLVKFEVYKPPIVCSPGPC